MHLQALIVVHWTDLSLRRPLTSHKRHGASHWRLLCPIPSDAAPHRTVRGVGSSSFDECRPTARASRSVCVSRCRGVNKKDSLECGTGPSLSRKTPIHRQPLRRTTKAYSQRDIFAPVRVMGMVGKRPSRAGLCPSRSLPFLTINLVTSEGEYPKSDATSSSLLHPRCCAPWGLSNQSKCVLNRTGRETCAKQSFDNFDQSGIIHPAMEPI